MDRRTFVGSTFSLAAATTLGATSLFAAEAGDRQRSILKVKGLRIVEGDRPVRLRGFNLGGWMDIEDYMIGLPWTEWKIREQFRKVLGEDAYQAFFGAYMDSHVAEADIAFLAEQGFTFVRLPFNYRHFESDFAPGQWLESGFRRLDDIIAICRKHNIWVLLDLHAAAGAQARDQNAGSAYGEAYFWYYRTFMDRSVALWREIARRYRAEPTVAGYNVLCEPVTDDLKKLNDVYAASIRAIREVDKDHMIVLDPNLWARDISSLEDRLFEDPQVVPALHHYYSETYAFERLTRYPDKIDGKAYDRAALAATMDGKHDQRRIQRPVIAAEFGFYRPNTQPFSVQLAITKDLVSIFEEKEWPWAMWCYKDVEHMGIVRPRMDTPWKVFLNSEPISGFLQKYADMEAPFTDAVRRFLSNTDIDLDTRENWADEVRRDFDPLALDYILRRLAGKSQSELMSMGQSFAFKNCQVDQDRLGILKPFLTQA